MTLAAFGWSIHGAYAHAHLISSKPTDGEILSAAPKSVTLTFSDRPDPSSISVGLRTPEGGSRQLRARASSKDPRVVSVSLPRVGSGTSVMDWRILTADGHPVSGQLYLHIGAPSVGDRAPAAASAAGSRDRILSWVAAGERFIWYLGLAFVIGAVYCLHWVERRRASFSGEAAGPLPLFSEQARRALSNGWVLLAVATAGRFAVAVVNGTAPGSALSLDALSSAATTFQSLVWISIVPITIVLYLLLRPLSRLGNRRLIAAAIVVFLLASPEALSGHALNSSHVPSALAIAGIHLVAVVAWVGPLLVTVPVAFQRKWRSDLPGRWDFIRRFFTDFSKFAVVVLAVLAVTGALLAWTNVARPGNLIPTAYGKTLIGKVALLALIGPIALYHRRLFGGAIRARATAGGGRVFALSAPVELGLLLTALGFAAFLTVQAPAKVAAYKTPSLRSPESLPQVSNVSECAKKQTLACYERYFDGVIKRKGVQPAVAELTRLVTTDRFAEGQCHQITHRMGHTASVIFADIGRALSFGSSMCNSGYYHGVLEHSVSRYDDAELLQKISTICIWRGLRQYSFDHFNCVHGLGHGVHLRTTNVANALAYCDALKDPWEQQSCFGGVFMQNIITEQMGGSGFDLRADDPIYPCNAVGERYKRECYQIVTANILKQVAFDYGKAFSICAGAEGGYVSTCNQSMGRDIAGAAVFDPKRAVELCSLAPEGARADCFAGAARTTAYNDRAKERALTLCASVAQEYRGRCETTVEEAASTF